MGLNLELQRTSFSVPSSSQSPSHSLHMFPTLAALKSLVDNLEVFAPLTTRDFWLSLWDSQAATIYLIWYVFFVAA
jgi:hypothetical protein